MLNELPPEYLIRLDGMAKVSGLSIHGQIAQILDEHFRRQDAGLRLAGPYVPRPR